MTQWKVRIPRHPNQHLQPGSHAHWRTVATAKREDTDDMYLAAKAAGLADDMPWSRCSVTVQIISGVNRRRDRDNWLGRCKGFLDGLTRAGVWTDDNGEVVTNAHIEFITLPGERPATVIMVTKED